MITIRGKKEFISKYVQVVETVWGANSDKLTYRQLEFLVSYIIHFNSILYVNHDRKVINKEMNEARKAVNRDMDFRGKDFYVWREKMMGKGWIQKKEKGYAPNDVFMNITNTFTVNEIFVLN